MEKCGQSEIFGVTKLDANHRVLSCDVVIGSFQNFNIESREFIKNFYLSDEWMQNANKNNEGFLGSIEKRTEGFYILCNGLMDDRLVTALRWADCNKGVGHVQGTKRVEKTWKELKSDLKERQMACVSTILQEGQKTETPIVEGESR